MRRVLVVLTVLAVGLAAVLATALAGGSTGASPRGAAQGSSATKVSQQLTQFKGQLARSGYVSQAGSAAVFDLDQRYCDGLLFSAMWPNPQSPYIITRMPEVPGQAANTNRLPGLVSDGNPVAVTSRLRQDEAIVMIGRTPPPMAYLLRPHGAHVDLMC